jgi:hypothetical protein
MCFAITLVHPYDASIPTFCNFVTPDVGICGNEIVGDIGDCDIQTFSDTTDWHGIGLKLAVCDKSGIDCYEGCADAVASVLADNPCFDGNMGNITRGFFVELELLNQMTSCSEVIYDTYTHDHDKDQDDKDKDHDNKCDGAACDDGAASSMLASVGLVTLLVGSLFI